MFVFMCGFRNSSEAQTFLWSSNSRQNTRSHIVLEFEWHKSNLTPSSIKYLSIVRECDRILVRLANMATFGLVFFWKLNDTTYLMTVLEVPKSIFKTWRLSIQSLGNLISFLLLGKLKNGWVIQRVHKTFLLEDGLKSKLKFYYPSNLFSILRNAQWQLS